MLVAAGFLAIPEAVKWNVMQVETIGRWTLVTSAPLLAFTALFVSFGIYLRMLYREVRRLNETDSLKGRFQQMRLRLFERSGSLDSSKQKSPPNGSRKEEAVEHKKRPAQPAVKPVVKEEVTEEEQSQPKGKRRWFGLRSAKPEASQQESNTAAEDDDQESGKKRRRFSLRLAPRTTGEVEAGSEINPNAQAEKTEEPKSKRRFGLAGFRRQRAAEAEAGEKSSAAVDSQRKSVDEQNPIDPDQIDWNGISKSERRRLRKQLKRQNKAA